MVISVSLACERVAALITENTLHLRNRTRPKRGAELLRVATCWNRRIRRPIKITRRRIILVGQATAQVEVIPEDIVIVVEDGQHRTAQLA